MKNKKAFTLIELLVVIAIIGILATLAVVALQQARKNSRDAKRMADVKQIQTALELYYNEVGYYPELASITANNSIEHNGTVYMAIFPSAPTPADGICNSSTNQYSYTPTSTGNSSYHLSFCLGDKVGNIVQGEKCATPAGILTTNCAGLLFGNFTRALYSEDEITELIQNQSYIPVANADEFNSISFSDSRIMGQGTPWQAIYSPGLDKKYVQVNNINLSQYQNGAGLNMIGSSSSPFSGVYDGANLSISNFIINRPSENNVGLFSYSSGASIKNIKISDFSITGSSNVGAFAYFINSNFENVSIKNAFISGRTYVGGLVGFMRTSTGLYSGVESSTVEGRSLVGTDCNMGGFVGALTESSSATQSLIRYSYVVNSSIYNTSNSLADRRIGGFVGFMRESGSVIRDSFIINSSVSVYGSQTGYPGVGGFVGVMLIGSSKIFNSYSNAVVTNYNLMPNGGFCGSRNSGSINNSYYDTNISTKSDTGKGLPMTTAQMKSGSENSFILANGSIDPDNLSSNSMYSGWDSSIWNFQDSNNYPSLRN